MKEDINKELVLQRFAQREYGLAHPTYDTELAFYQLVQSGDIKAIMERKKNGEFKNVAIPARGVLSDDSIRNMKYHIIVTLAMIARFCIEGGLDERVSYGLSDIYIKKIDKANSVDTLLELHEELIFDYAERMKKINSAKRLSIHCIKAMDFISDNLHKTVTVQETADYLGLDRTYLSKLFKSETGQNISDYIRCTKIQTAQNMLVYSEFSCSEISQYLGFASQSHFTECFKKYCGLTPSEYRSDQYRRHWTK